MSAIVAVHIGDTVALGTDFGFRMATVRMFTLQEMLQTMADELTRPTIEKFGDVKVADYATFSPEKKREYMEAVTASLAALMLCSSPFLRGCIRVWGIDQFMAQFSTAMRTRWKEIEDATDEALGKSQG